MATQLENAPASSLGRSRCWGLAVFLAGLIPSLAAIWLVPGFATQDGPAHLYNAQILVESFRQDSPFRDYYQVRWQPLPNWSGHLITAALFCLSPRWTDAAVTTIIFAGFAASILWLRWIVVGWRGMPAVALLAVMLGLNVVWLLGFTSFLLGACLFSITLGYWWVSREQLGVKRALVLGLLVALGYFCHLVSLGLTVAGVGILTLFAPSQNWKKRFFATCAALTPLIPLAGIYLVLSRQGGGMHPVWENLRQVTSLKSWLAQAGWVEPISLASRVSLPFRQETSSWYALLAPLIWVAVGLILAGVATLRAPVSKEHRCWWILALLLLFGGLVSPDTLGANHGNYLQQRIVLLGLVALVPALALDVDSRLGQGAALALAVAVTVQSAFVWDYALTSNQTAGIFLRVRPTVGRGQRIATLLLQTRGKFRANPIWHADNLLGVGTGNIVWNNYETRHYYFPVQFDPRLSRPSAAEMERIATLDGPEDAKARLEAWTHLLEEHHSEIDKLLVWGADPAFSAVNERWFQLETQQGKLQVLRRR